MKKMDRRSFLKGLGACTAGAATMGAVPGLSPKLALGQSAAGFRLCVVNFGGGIDSLAMAQPDMGSLADIRPTLYDSVSTLALGGPGGGPNNISLHSSLTRFQEVYNAGDLCLINKTGYGGSMSRSHEIGERNFAKGIRTSDQSNSTNSGWINRLSAANFTSRFHTFDFTGGHYTTTQGAFSPTALNQLSAFGFDSLYQGGNHDTYSRDMAMSLISGWNNAGGAQQEALQNGWAGVRDAVDTIRNLTENPTFPGGAFPDNNRLGRQLRDAFLVFSGLDTKIAYTRDSGYDTHGGQGDRLNGLLTNVNAAVAAFIDNMAAAGLWGSCILLFVSEFSRTKRENGNFGTDHGSAFTCAVMGPSVRGGILGTYEDADFNSGPNWLIAQNNYTDVLAAVISKLGYDPTSIVPGASPMANIF